MTTKHTPATPPLTHTQREVEKDRRANAYPRLVDFVRLVAIGDAGPLGAQVLLRELGEDA